MRIAIFCMCATSTKPDILTPSPFIRALPKAELHLHLEGTVAPATLVELSSRNHSRLPWDANRYGPSAGGALDAAAVRRLYQYDDFHGFLMAFKAVTERLRTPGDYETVAYKMMEQLRAQNVLHAEVYVSVGVVHWRGQDFAPIFEGLERGRIAGERDFGISLLWIFDAVRNFGVEAAQLVAEDAARFRDRNVIGIGIGGDERKGPAEMFKDVYAYAAGQGLHLTAHAGESAGPESIWGALNMGAERIGHGLTAGQDPELIEILAERQIPIEVCITSNVKTQCLAHSSEHPLGRYFHQGLMTTINTDDPAMFGVTLNQEYQLAQDLFDFTDDHLREIARNSFEASFLAAEKKVEFLHMVDEVTP